MATMEDSSMQSGLFNHYNTTAPSATRVLPLFSLSGKTAIVSGAGAGIGLAVAEALAEAGANVAIWYNSNKKALDRAAEIERTYGVKCKSCHPVSVTRQIKTDQRILFRQSIPSQRDRSGQRGKGHQRPSQGVQWTSRHLHCQLWYPVDARRHDQRRAFSLPQGRFDRPGRDVLLRSCRRPDLAETSRDRLRPQRPKAAELQLRQLCRHC